MCERNYCMKNNTFIFQTKSNNRSLILGKLKEVVMGLEE